LGGKKTKSLFWESVLWQSEVEAKELPVDIVHLIMLA
jgi:hypothetical protein